MNTLRLIAVILATGAVAFIAGWLVSKASLHLESAGPSVSREKHRKVLRALRNRYTRRINRLEALIRRHEAAGGQAREKIQRIESSLAAKNEFAATLESELADQQQTVTELMQAVAARNDEVRAITAMRDGLQSQLDAESSRAAAARNELALSRIERDELEARIRRLEASRRELSEALDHESDTAELRMTHTAIEDQRAALGELRETLASREHRIRELELLLKERESRLTALENRLREWKHRMAPLAQQLRKHQEMARSAKTRAHKTPARQGDGRRDAGSRQPGLGQSPA